MWLSSGPRGGAPGNLGGGGRKRRENSFIILCIHKSCLVTVLERMLPLFAKGLQTGSEEWGAGALGREGCSAVPLAWAPWVLIAPGLEVWAQLRGGEELCRCGSSPSRPGPRPVCSRNRTWSCCFPGSHLDCLVTVVVCWFRPGAFFRNHHIQGRMQCFLN